MTTKEELDKLIGKKVCAILTKSGTDYPINGKLLETRSKFGRIEGKVEFSGTSKWFTIQKISEYKKP